MFAFTRRSVLFAAASLLALSGCEQSPTAADDLSLQVAELNDPRGGTGRTSQPNLLQQLLQQAFRTTLEQDGEAAVRALHAQLQPFEAALREALASRDRQAVARAQAALKAEQISIIVRVLGAAAPRSVIDTADQLLDDAAAKIAAAKAAGRDVERLEARLRQVTQLYTDATAALQSGQLSNALQLGLQAVDGARALLRLLA